MILLTFHDGDVFTTSQPAIMHGVNTVGDMGSGIARVIKEKYPDLFEVYFDLCEVDGIYPGRAFGLLPDGEHRWIINIASQDLGGANARLDWLEESLRNGIEICIQNNLTGFAAPRIGAGVGGLDWSDVLSIFETVADENPELEIEIWTL